MSESDATWLPLGIARSLTADLRERWVLSAVGGDVDEVEMNIVELLSHFSQIVLGLGYLRTWT